MGAPFSCCCCSRATEVLYCQYKFSISAVVSVCSLALFCNCMPHCKCSSLLHSLCTRWLAPVSVQLAFPCLSIFKLYFSPTSFSWTQLLQLLLLLHHLLVQIVLLVIQQVMWCLPIVVSSFPPLQSSSSLQPHFPIPSRLRFWLANSVVDPPLIHHSTAIAIAAWPVHFL